MIVAAFVMGVLALSGSTLSASSEPCSIHPKPGTTKEERVSIARLTRADAQKAALASLKGKGKRTVTDAELEAEDGCLVYSFDIVIAGKKGIQEVQVDAGSGRVLSSKHESEEDEAAERAKDGVKPRS